jgi:hypothetical protein
VIAKTPQLTRLVKIKRRPCNDSTHHDYDIVNKISSDMDLDTSAGCNPRYAIPILFSRVYQSVQDPK